MVAKLPRKSTNPVRLATASISRLSELRFQELDLRYRRHLRQLRNILNSARKKRYTQKPPDQESTE